jgi:hypothetical protein
MLEGFLATGSKTDVALSLLALLASPRRRSLAGVLFEEMMEVAWLIVAKHVGDHANLRRRHPAQERLSECEPRIDLALEHALAELFDEGPFKRPHLDTEFLRDRPEPELHMTVVEQKEVLHHARRIPQEFLMKLILGRRPPGSYLCDHFSLDGREFVGDGTSHEYFLWTLVQQLPLDSTNTSNRAASATFVGSLVAEALKVATQPGLAVFGSASDPNRLRTRASNRWQSRIGTPGRRASSGSQMEMCWGGLQKTVSQSTAGASSGNTCNSHGHVSSLGSVTRRCNVTQGTRATIMSARAIVLSFKEETTTRDLCQGSYEPVSYRKRLRCDMELCIHFRKVIAIGSIERETLRSTTTLRNETSICRQPASPQCLPSATESR